MLTIRSPQKIPKNFNDHDLKIIIPKPITKNITTLIYPTVKR